MSPARTASDGRAVRCYVFARASGTDAGHAWLLGLLPGTGTGPTAGLPGEHVPDGTDPAAAALHAVSRLTGTTASRVTPPVSPLERPWTAGTVRPTVPPWWVRASEDGPYGTEYEYVLTVPGAPPAGLRWLTPAAARARAHPQDENLRLAAALGGVMEELVGGRITPAVIRAMTVGHSRRGLGGPRTAPEW
ncbi:hypothetical protein PUR71_10880 [Streptomyces sp. SP17BM10]|uniref:hypothetical protein n=1 Tax=Streptomyces sp. SP17BM10 TaxID=3002530 RepID=UPI002E76D65D|nr:hypothetical protein [Streptomyces sp. SP17BM10]MEE1783415.1 hypothetical protein [Streptomyces sp. SP17BM10]